MEVASKKWLRRSRGAVGMGITWAAAWGLVGVLIGIFVDPDGSIDDMWVATLGLPGFLGGVAFSVVLGFGEGRRRFEELSLARVGAWGALAGLLLGLVPFLAAEPTAAFPRWLLGLVTIAPMTVLSAVSAAGSLALARSAESGGVREGPAAEEHALRGAAERRDAERGASQLGRGG